MKALDILSDSTPSGESRSGDSLLEILNIGRPTKNVGAFKAESKQQSIAMTHVNESTCPKCHNPMETAFIESEEVFFCPKHAVTMPKRLS